MSRAILVAVIVVIIIVIGALLYRYVLHTTYPLSALWYNLPSGLSQGGALVLVTSTPLPTTAVGKMVKASIKSTNAGAPVNGIIAAAFAPYVGKITAIDTTGTVVLLTPVPGTFSTAWSAGVTAVGSLGVYHH